ncbi:hypothetical protein RND81_04G206500 [Saponaria officinalis]|uniref:Autophagy-related protein 18a n=1 Tax=Saponaria officinalis TaxID=3572 RepID=A0AAW1LN70_SAPOF
MEEVQNTENTLNSVTFNQDATCISAATTTGIIILTASPYNELFRRQFSGGISAAHMLFRCQLLAIFGGHFPANKLMIFDDNKSSCIGELTFRSPVISARLRRDRIIVVLAKKILVYNFIDLKLVHLIETVENPKGLCEVSCASTSFVLICPGLHVGQVRVENYGSSRRTKFISAHGSKINCLGLTTDGRFLATASTKGTLIRVFNALDGTLLQEVRRGTDKAEIQSIAFSFDARWLAASSDRGTIHVFSLKLDSGSIANNGLQSLPQQPSSPRSPMSSISFMKGVLPKYFSSEWSLAQFHLTEGIRYIVAFGRQESTVVIVGMDGSYYRCKFDPVSGGEMTQLEFHNFLKPQEPSRDEELTSES